MPSTATNRLQGLTTSVAVKPPCITVATTNITLSGLQTISGVTVVEDDRVLVKGQSTASENGIYNASTGSWTRALDFDGELDAVSGTRVLIVSSSGNGVEYELTTTDPIVIGTTALTFTLRYGANATFDRTEAEIVAGVTPTDYSIPNHLANGIIYDARYGATEGGSNLAALDKCNLVAAQLSGSTIGLLVNSLVAAPWVVTAPNIKINGLGHSLQFHPSAAKAAAGPDWAPYYQLLVVNANNVETFGIRFKGNLVVSTSNYFGGCSFVWYGQNLVGGSVHHCSCENLRYIGGNNNVAVQIRNGSSNIHVHHMDFLNCAGGVSHQGLHGSVSYTTHQITDAAAATPLTDTAGVFDQPIGIDGSTGMSVLSNKVYLSSGAPYSGALIGANVSTTNFIIAHNEIYGMRGGVGYYIRSSNRGKLSCNLIDGLSYVATASWAMIRVDADSNDIDVSDNTMRGAMSAIAGTALSVYTGGNTCSNNKVLMGSVSAVALEIAKATTPAESTFDNNYLQSGGIGTKLNLADNILASTGIEVPIIHRNNTFATPVTTPYSCSGVSRQIKFYVENDAILSTSYNAAANILPPRIQQMFRAGLAANFGFKVGVNLDIHGVEVPSGANYYLATYETGDVVHHSQTVAGGTEGWKCTTGGTIPDGTPYSQAGTSTDTSPTITALANTTLVLVGDYVSPSAGFATTGPFKVIAKTATTLTLNVNANATGATTVTHFAPVFKAQPNVAA